MKNYYKNSIKEINFINEFNDIQKYKIFQEEFQKVKNDDNEIIELELNLINIEEEVNILCDKDELIKNNKINESFYNENNIIPSKEI